MDTYSLVLSEDAALVLANAPRSDQRKLVVIFDGLKASPFRRGDLQERDAKGRVNEVFVMDDWLVTYWLDDASRELRVVRLERVDD